MPVGEFGFIDIAAHRHRQIDFAVGIGEQRNRQIQRQIDRRWTFHALAQRELFQQHLVLAQQFAVVEFVLQIERQLAAGDTASGEGRAVGCQRRHRDIAEIHRHIGKHFGLEGIQGATDLRLAEFIDAAFELQGRARARLRGKPADGATELADHRGERQHQALIGEIHFAVAHVYTLDVDHERRFGCR